MKNFIILAALAAAAAAFAADYVVERAPAGPAQPPLNEDAVVDLQWDNGTRSNYICFYSGAGTWLVNDFDLSQIPDYTRVTRLLVYTSPTWPNAQWDGFRIGLYGFSGSTPTSLLWGPKFVKAGLTSAGWANFSVAWTLPPTQLRFAAGFEQYYNYPTCDPHTVDNNRTFRLHSWLYYGGTWRSYTNSTGYYNLMIRVRVSNAYVGLTPTSVGRVKALYY
jgi:opacity protein-like surface antigen